ncbi:MAG: glycosyltransferase family 2 protein, partial [Firmicutes bacterium]|nr:glycosyltransferase family 2 protein [Bacillota bacterium]
LFLDGDTGGPVGPFLADLAAAVLTGKLDLALSGCFREDPGGRSLASETARARESLNRRLGLWGAIGQASPSHGPFACSARLARCARARDFAVPPLVLVRAAAAGMAVGVGARFPHALLGSPYRGPEHARLTAETIIGDCAEAISVVDGRRPSRHIWGREYQGLNPYRRFDVLDELEAQYREGGGPDRRIRTALGGMNGPVE